MPARLGKRTEGSENRLGNRVGRCFFRISRLILELQVEFHAVKLSSIGHPHQPVRRSKHGFVPSAIVIGCESKPRVLAQTHLNRAALIEQPAQSSSP